MDRPLPKPASPPYRRWLLLSIGSALALAVCTWLYTMLAQRMHSVTVDSGDLIRFPIETRTLAEVAGAIATIQSSQIAYVDSVSHGIVDTILVEPGERVEAGQVLVTLGNPEVILDAAAKEADVVQQINNLLITELTLTQTIANRRQELERLCPATSASTKPASSACASCTPPARSVWKRWNWPKTTSTSPPACTPKAPKPIPPRTGWQWSACRRFAAPYSGWSGQHLERGGGGWPQRALARDRHPGRTTS